MRVICPRCSHARSKSSPRMGTRVTCTKCGAVATYKGRGQGFSWEFPSEPLSRETNETWSFPTYLDAKMAAIARQVPAGHRFPVCPVCDNAAVAGHCHHVFLSQRYKIAKCDLRNIIIVCNPTYANCHTRAHGDAKEKVENKLKEMLGEGNQVRGHRIVREAMDEWMT